MCRGRGRAFYYIYIYSGKRKSGEGAELVGVLVAETIHPACMCEGGGLFFFRVKRVFIKEHVLQFVRFSD